MKRTQEMQAFVDAIANSLFGRSNSEAVASKTCLCCGREATSFRDELCRKEFGISGMCQICQDEIFEAEEE